jgi:hypothetical protein
MEHANKLSEFIPSVEEALLYKREWRLQGGQDFDHYQRLKVLFENPADTQDVLIAQCEEIYRSYDPRNIGRVQQAIDGIAHIQDFINRARQGDIDIVMQLRPFGGYVFSVMFCHHSNTESYFGCTSPVRETLVNLNKFDCFYPGGFTETALTDYLCFHNIMTQFVKYYHLESLTHLELDIMLRKASELK